MFDRYRGLIQKFAMSACVAALVLVGQNSGICEEPDQSSQTADKPEETQAKKNILQYRAYRPSQGVPGTANFNDHMPALTAPPQTTPSIPSRRNAEMLDREKNWIFLSPGDKPKGDSIEDILGVDEMTLDGKAKGVVTKFLENKPPKDPKSNGMTVNAWDKDPNEFGFPQTFGLGNEKENRSGGLVKPNSLDRNFSTQRNREMSLQELWNERNGPRAEKMREEKQLRMSEFESLFGSQGAAPNSGGFNALGGQSGFGLQPATAPGGFDLFNGSAPPPVRVSDPRSVAPRVGGGANPSAPTDINTRVFGPSAAPALAPETKKFEAQPAILPVPKRRF